MPIQYVDNHPTIAYDGVNDKLKVNDATLEQKIDDLNTKIDAIISGDSPATTLTELSGSIPEYGWIDGDTEPTPTGFAFGAKVDSTTGNITCMYWNGTAWVEVE